VERSGAGRVDQGGRSKAYRPLPEKDRLAAVAQALDAYGRGDFFEAHELLEPAWMGTADPTERELYQALIKVAAAYVHDVRGNRRGRDKSLASARRRLAAVVAAGADSTRDHGLDLAALLTAIDERLAVPDATLPPPSLRRPRRDVPG
jgi:predicted metal-dependent hydrolase